MCSEGCGNFCPYVAYYRNTSLIGQTSGSVVATADGTDSLSDAMISFIVFMGLVIAGRPADKKFHFGYYKVESFAALIAAIGMIVMGSIILYHSSGSLLLQHKHEIRQPVLTMIVLVFKCNIPIQGDTDEKHCK